MEGSKGNAETYMLTVDDEREMTTTCRQRLPEVWEVWGSVLNERAWGQNM